MINTLKHKLTLAGRKFTEAWTSCLLCMVQGDLTVLTMKHATTAGKTGLLTALAVLLLSFSNRFPNNQYTLAWLTGVLTTIADIVAHKPHFYGESVLTGVGAGVLALVLSKTVGKSS